MRDELQLPSTPCVLRAAVYSHALSARYYGLPVYLVGSALTAPDPRDIDIVIPIPNKLFIAMYGDNGDNTTRWKSGSRTSQPPPLWLRWARDCAKQSLELTMFCHRQVDFKTQPQTEFDTFSGPRLRLDCDIFATAKSNNHAPVLEK